jgi:adenosylcobinamide-GDP ribazoletransferase
MSLLPNAALAGLASDIKIGVLFCTRLPIGSPEVIDGADLARAGWAMPIAGAIVGALGSLSYWVANALGLPPMAGAMLALVAMLIFTGALHEDGLADTADGFGGGHSRERKLAIMRDSRIGTYGVCAILASLVLQWSALVTIAEPRGVAMALIAAQVSARAILPAFMRFVPPARTDGLSAGVGKPPAWSVAAAVAIGVIVLAISLHEAATIVALLLLLLSGLFMGWLSVNQIGGQTGDVLGALEQIGAVVTLLTAAALH